MNHFLLSWLTALACLGVFSPPHSSAMPTPDQPDKPNLNGTWTLDLKGSDHSNP
jgi:hypothetical protein